MKKTGLSLIFFGMMLLPAMANDFILEFIEENYREQKSAFSHSPIIYHSIQVSTLGKTKLLVLKGDNPVHRKWIREYIAENKDFIAVVPETETHRFIASDIFEMDISNLHPVNLSKYRQDEMGKNEFTAEEWEMLLGTGHGQKSKTYPRPARPPEESKDQTTKDQATADQKKQAVREAQEQRQEIENQLKVLGEKKRQDEFKRLQEIEETKERSQKQRAEGERLREDEMEERWQAFQKMMIEDESIRMLEQKERYREMKRRWLEQQSRF